jgi:hypothetical protein
MDDSPKIVGSGGPSKQNTQRMGNSWFGGPLTDLSRVSIPSFGFVTVGCICIVVFSLSGRDIVSALRAAAGWLIIAGGVLVSGVVTGFLFAVPRTLQRGEVNISSSRMRGSSTDNGVDQAGADKVSPVRTQARYTVNSNLEQISDWLTKIIVGVGLVELYKLPGLASRLTTFLAGGAESIPQGRAFALGLILYFGVLGFMAGYLLTRIYVTSAFVRADAENDQIL